ncbi:ABC transporter ATP-binding protein [Nocardiopsis sp. NPDC101807]|uniref:ABC transporter ATP-binding protein n=1 Tax=Nocardiopsis sp. NPDC101807 TaxID=3364339 RepID=UPI0037FF5D16
MSLVAEGVTCRYGPQTVLDGVDVTVEPGRVLGLTGPSGSGKSSLARILTGLRAPDSGTVLADGRPVSARRGRMSGDLGLLHQSPRAATDPRMRLRGIIAQPLTVRRRGTGPGIRGAGRGADDARRVAELARRVGLTGDLLDRRPDQVSAGQLQRACVARALAAAPRYLVCDEPTAMLDAASTAAVAHLLTSLAEDGVGILAISHDHALLDAWAHDVADLSQLEVPRAGHPAGRDASP